MRVASGAVLVRIGSRGSRLALRQAELAAERLRCSGVEIAFVPITTVGDRDRTKPFGEIGARGVFVKELEEALLGGRIDVAVHSAKDMTSTDTAGLAVGAYLERDDPRDALVGAPAIRPGMRIGTASVRRKAQLLALEPTVSCWQPAAWTDLASPGRSACGSTPSSCCPRRGKVRLRCRCAPATSTSLRARMTPRRAAVSRRNVAASRRSAAAASRRSLRITTERCSVAWSLRRTERGCGE